MESVQNGNIVCFEYDEFQKLKLNTKNQHNLIHYQLTEKTKVYDFHDGERSLTQRNLEDDQGWYYQKLKYIPAKSYVLHKMLKPEVGAFISHFTCALENTMTIPYYKLSMITVPFYIESLVLYILAAFFFILNLRHFKGYFSSDNVFLWLFAFLSIILIGYSTPIVGNIIRHKTLAMLFLIVVVLRIGFQTTNSPENK